MPLIPNELIMSRVYDAPRPLVWSVWTDPKHLRQWWGPFGPEHTSCELDFRVGGEFSVMMKARDGATIPARAEILEILEPERIVYEGAADAPTACGAGLPPKARVTVLFEAIQQKTRLTVETLFPDMGALEAANAAGYTDGWNMTLNELGERIKGGAFKTN
ncbi:SRPBCC domain-containing protein [Hyphococcus flavus]|uniref:SRPBCC domain-containing protein n=1 Tax=Hyphococcus flavus TaxID=1866326 RepID=A0AAE9ZGT4_9PROT|nr:SRPBCC domain-containing protein [Hyphococcus flavus]WDI32287.1 SRPBCC domain-containing protein [Hyphococcus flavus]